MMRFWLCVHPYNVCTLKIFGCAHTHIMFVRLILLFCYRYHAKTPARYKNRHILVTRSRTKVRKKNRSGECKHLGKFNVLHVLPDFLRSSCRYSTKVCFREARYLYVWQSLPGKETLWYYRLLQ